MSENQKIFNQAINAGCKTAKDLAIYIKEHSKNRVKFLEITEHKAIKRYFKETKNKYISC